MGGTLARYAAAHVPVVVVHGTRGEEGEIHNHDDPDSMRATLGEIRSLEVAAALDALGVTDHHFLEYRDSGMMGEASNHHVDSFWQADFMEATGRLVRLIRRYQPDVVTAYDPYGGYGHPDHIQVHRVGTAAFFGAGDIGRFPLVEGEKPWDAKKLYWATFPRSGVKRMMELRLAAGEISAEEAAVEPGAGSRDEDITTWVDVADFAVAKEKAVLAHRTQIPEDSWFRTMPDEMKDGFFSREPLTLAFTRVPTDPAATDLFDGI